MGTERIERALREGPPDEPVYVPGAFRRSGGWRAGPAIITAVVGLALVAGLVIGTGLLVLRGEDVGVSPQPRILATSDLLGTWRTDQISRQAWTDGISAAGFDSAAITAFLEHDPIQNRVRYTLEFFTSETTGDRVTIKAEYDGQPIVVLSGGGFSLEADGTLDYTEIVPGTAAPRCEVFAAPAIDDGGQLSLQILETRNCDPDAKLAHTAFFALAPFARQDP